MICFREDGYAGASDMFLHEDGYAGARSCMISSYKHAPHKLLKHSVWSITCNIMTIG